MLKIQKVTFALMIITFLYITNIDYTTSNVILLYQVSLTS
jgi:hypothetical protein